NTIQVPYHMRKWIGYVLFAVVLYPHITYLLRDDVEEVVQWTIADQLPRLRYTSNCTMTTCLDVRRVGGTGRLRVWLQPVVKMRDEKGSLLTPLPSREFMQLRDVIASSEWTTVDEKEATLVVPGVDFLNQERFEGDSLRVVYDRLKEKYDRRMIIYSFHGRKLSEDTAVIASAQPVSSRFRRDFDVSLPVWRGDVSIEEKNIGMKHKKVDSIDGDDMNEIGLLILQLDDVENGLDTRIREAHTGLENVVWMRRCQAEIVGDLCDESGRQWSYEEALGTADFVLISDDLPAYDRLLIDGLRAGMIPIIVAPSYVLPFEEKIDWSRFSLSLLSLTHLKGAMEGLREDDARMEEMRRQGGRMYTTYFSRLESIVTSSLRLIESRLVPHRQWTYERWNGDEIELTLDLPYLASEEIQAVAVVMEEEREISGVKYLLESKRIDRVIVVGKEGGGDGEERISHWILPSAPDPTLSLMMRLLKNPSQVFLLLRGAADDDGERMRMDPPRIERAMMIWRTTPTGAVFVVNAEGRVLGVVVHKAILDWSVRHSQQLQQVEEWSYDSLVDRLAAAAVVKMVVGERVGPPGTDQLPSLPTALSAVPRV
ncbi:hypothetical protein PENTCL1PPCAC_5965, partial [Pristionchus entomophagus]